MKKNNEKTLPIVEPTKKRNRKIILTILIIILGASGYICFRVFFNKDDSEIIVGPPVKVVPVNPEDANKNFEVVGFIDNGKIKVERIEIEKDDSGGYTSALNYARKNGYTGIKGLYICEHAGCVLGENVKDNIYEIYDGDKVIKYNFHEEPVIEEDNNESGKNEEDLLFYDVNNSGNLLCSPESISCYITQYITEMSYFDLKDLINPSDKIIGDVLYMYLLHVGGRNDLFIYEEDGFNEPYYRVSKELLDTLIYIMFARENVKIPTIKDDETEGIYKINDRVYEVRMQPHGGPYYSIIRDDINKISEKEYNVKLYLGGFEDDGIEIEPFESGTYNLKYNTDKKLFYVNKIIK